VHGQRGDRLPTVPRLGRPAGFLPGLRPCRRVPRHRRHHGRLPPGPVPAPDGPGQGARLVVVDPRRTATADKADLFLPIRPGTDLALRNGLLHLLVENGHTDPELVAELTEGWEAMPGHLADYPPAKVAEITGLEESEVRTAAGWIGEARDWMSCWTMGLNQSTHGTWNTNALCNLHLGTGAICRVGRGPFSLTGQPNAMGGREMGCMGPGLPGQRSVLVEADRRFVERLWGLPEGTVGTDVGTGTIDMFARMAAGEIKGCWIICTNPVATVANRAVVIDGLAAAEFVVTQDVFAATETNAYADVVLPGVMWAETEGVMINSQWDLTLLQAAVDPPGQALADWRTGGSSPGSPARWASPTRSPTPARRRSSRRSSRLGTPPPATTSAV
jgi:sulfite reductase (NADPH) flavoprotein alpha-component